MRIETGFSNNDLPSGAAWTQEAVASLVGQRPRVTANFDWQRPLGWATVVAARLEGDRVILTLDVEPGPDREDLPEALRPNVGVGYTMVAGPRLMEISPEAGQ